MNMKKTIIILVVIILAALILWWVLLNFVWTPSSVQAPTSETRNAVQELTEGTTATDIEQDLQALEGEQLLGDIDEEVVQMEEQLQAEGL